MAEPSVDIAALTEEQQLALQTYTAVTDQEIDKAIPLLQRCQWNPQIAITRFFDGEPAEDPVAAAAAEQAAPQDIRRQETLMNGFTPPRSSLSSARVNIEPAPRVVPQPEGQVRTQVPLVLAVLFAPVSLVYSLVGKWFRFMGRLFPFLPRAWGRVTSSNINAPVSNRSTGGRRPLNTRDTAARFIREFEEEYGSQSEGLPFFENGYAQAFDLAKKNLQFLLVVLVSPEHDETSSFVQDTLLSPEVVEFIRDPANNIILWAGNVQDSEAYQVSVALNCTKFPFTGLVVHTPRVSSTAMGIATRIAGPTPPAQYISKLKAAMQQHTAPLERARNQRAEQQATRNIRQQQDSAYERSLATDRERARKRKEEAELKAKEEKEALEREQTAQLYAQNLLQWRKWRASTVPSEPSTDDKEAVRISVRMPNAERVLRRFTATADIEELYAFVECYDILQSSEQTSEKVSKPKDFTHEYKFQLVSPIPREVFDFKLGGTIKERIGRSGNLIVERTGIEEEEEEEEESDE